MDNHDYSMNYKNLNYEIETRGLVRWHSVNPFTMNYKNLNYEIETCRICHLNILHPAMNYKNLNYEIETQV